MNWTSGEGVVISARAWAVADLRLASPAGWGEEEEDEDEALELEDAGLARSLITRNGATSTPRSRYAPLVAGMVKLSPWEPPAAATVAGGPRVPEWFAEVASAKRGAQEDEFSPINGIGVGGSQEDTVCV